MTVGAHSSSWILRLALAGLIAAALLAGVALATPSAAAANAPIGVASAGVLADIPADEGGSGVNNAGSSEWIVFSVGLGPFIILVSCLLWITFGIDKSEGRE